MRSSPISQSQPRLLSTESRTAQDALITAHAAPLVELRQNNPQDCANLIAASVDRATVEISRTIIALNATFSQQLQQASISASNGIKSAENSASSSISIVSQNASSATSSASFSLNLANLAVTSVNSALSNANIALVSAQSQVSGVNLILTSALSASTSDVLRLSSSLSSLEANLASVKASASTAVALAVMSQQSLKDPQGTAAISLAPIQLAGIVVGTMLASVFLSFAAGFVLVRARHQARSGSFNTKGSARDPLSRDSMVFRPGNSVVIKFSPPTSVHDIPPAPERHGSLSANPSSLYKEQLPMSMVQGTKVASENPFASRTDGWPLTANFDDLDGTSDELWPQDIMTIPRNMSAQNADSTPGPPFARRFSLDKSQNIAYAIKFASPPRPEPIETAQEMDMDEDSLPICEPSQESSHILDAEREPEDLVPAAEVLEDPFKDLASEAYEALVEGRFGDFVEQSPQPIKESSKILTDDGSFEEPVGQEAKISWDRPYEALLEEDAEGLATREVEDSLPEPGISSPVVVAHTQNPEALHSPEQSETTGQRSSLQHIPTTSPKQIQGNVPGIRAVAIQTLPDLADGKISPLHRPSTVSLCEQRVEPQSPDAVNAEREISPLRRNPPFEPLVAMFSLLGEKQGGAVKLEEEDEEDADEYESRGRSMIRTSDIIEARLSGLAQVKDPQQEILQQRGRPGELNGILSAGAAHPQQFAASDQARRLQVPPKQKPVVEITHVVPKQATPSKTSPPLVSNSLSRPVSATSAAATSRREEASPLRRNPPGINPPPRRALGIGATESSNTEEFSKALSKFQTLISQNPQDAVVASNEVTSRAIAGIYIPGSLREQAVRNLSKSRERGTGERQRK